MKKGRAEKGFVLVLTLLITAILAAIVTEVIYSVQSGSTFAASFRDSRQALVLMEAGVDFASARIKREMEGKSFTTLALEGAKEMITPAGALQVRVEDESGKFPVNMVLYPNGAVNEQYFSAYLRLLDILGLDRSLSETLADWIDEDDEPRPSGAERMDYYGKLAPPVRPKGAAVDSIDEMMLIKKYSPTIVKRLAPFVTPYGEGKVNINTAPKEVLMSLSDEITGAAADRIIEYRSREPFKDPADIRKVKGMETAGFSVQGLVTVKSDTFMVFSKGRSGEGVREAQAVIKPREGRVVYWRER